MFPRKKRRRRRKLEMHQENLDLDYQILEVTHDTFRNKNNDIDNRNNTINDIIQIWKNVCGCKDKLFEENNNYLIETIKMMEKEINDIKMENRKLVKENGEMKIKMKELNEALVVNLPPGASDKQKQVVVGTDGNCEDTGLQGSSLTTATEDHAWLFTTKQWLENKLDDMNPSTDSDNFEKTNNMKGKMSGANGDSNDCVVEHEGEDVVQRYQTNSYFEEYDEVFEDVEEAESESVSIATYSSSNTTRVRRISDVIDSIGDHSPSYVTKEKSHSFSSYDIASYRLQEFNLQSPPRVRPLSTMIDGIGPCSPPMTPGSDLGYGSTGMPTPPSNIFRPKSFRFSTSSVDIAASPPKWDTQIDAKPIAKEAVSSMSNNCNWNKAEAKQPVEKDSRSYNMSHPRRGRAVIFNHEEFRDMPARKGSGEDVMRLTKALSALGFVVETHTDLEIEKLNTTIGELAADDHSEADCVVVAVLTHGLSTGCLMAKDYAYPTEHLWAPFTPDKCPSLAGKPKIFFIQACRGDKLDPGIRLLGRQQTQTDNSTSSYKIPLMADFLLAFSTFEGFYSWRHPENGTWFVQCLCQVLEEEGKTSSLQNVLTEVSRRVAFDYQSYNDVFAWQHDQKQVPQINSTLLRHVYFTPKD